MKKFIESKYAKDIINYHCPRYEEYPDIGFYMEQVVELLNKNLSVFRIDNRKYITSTMINNYVKQKIIEAPKNKKYSRNQICWLFAIGILKQILNINELSYFVKISLNAYPIDVAFNFLCTELENAIKAAFVTRDFSEPSSASKDTEFSEAFRSALLSFTNKVYIAKFLQYNKDLEEEKKESQMETQ